MIDLVSAEKEFIILIVEIVQLLDQVLLIEVRVLESRCEP